MVPATVTSLPNFFTTDIELLGLVSDLRRAAKKEGPDAVKLMEVADELRAGGWYVERNDRTGCAYVSADPSLIARLIELGALPAATVRTEPYGRIANLADPDGNLFDLCAYRD